MMRLGQTRGVGAGQEEVGGNFLKFEPLLFKMELFPLLPKTIMKLAGLLQKATSDGFDDEAWGSEL